jgi:hypothetical protein
MASPYWFFVLRSLVPMLALAFLAQAGGETPAGWKVYKGHYFEIGVPPGFVATPQGEVTKGRADEVSLWNEKTQVQFCVYSPLWNGEAIFKEVGDRAEILTSRESKKTGDVVEEQLTITARDKSYVRFVVSRINVATNNNTTFGVRVPNMKVYEQIRPLYVQWKKTLVQFSD